MLFFLFLLLSTCSLCFIWGCLGDRNDLTTRWFLGRVGWDEPQADSSPEYHPGDQKIHLPPGRGKVSLRLLYMFRVPCTCTFSMQRTSSSRDFWNMSGKRWLMLHCPAGDWYLAIAVMAVTLESLMMPSGFFEEKRCR